MDSQGMQQQFRQMMHYWFIRYNPLYFFSALCVLGGVFLISSGLEEMVWTPGQLALSAIAQCYEFLLLGAAGLLYRRRSLARPAVILGLIELSFLFDNTFRAEVFTTLDVSGTLPAAVSIVLLILKLNALLWAFRLNASVMDLILPVAAGSVVTVIPQLIDRYYSHAELIHVCATGFGIVLIGAFVWRRPEIHSSAALSEWGQTVLRRCLYCFRILPGVFYVLHLLVWVDLFSLRLSALHLLLLISLLPLIATQKGVVWTVCAIALVAVFGNPPWVAPTAAVLGILFLIKAFHLKERHFFIGAVLACYLAIWVWGWKIWPFPPVNLWLTLAAVLVLLILAWKFKLPSALTPLAAGLYPLARLFASLNHVQIGGILLALGFVALLLGVGINWRQSGG